MKNEYSVVVIGGGPAGATAAKEVAKSGLSTLLVEKDLAHDKPCGGGIFIKAFDEFDIPVELIKKRITAIEIFSPDKERVSVDIADFPLGVVSRVEFDTALRDLAVQAGADLIEGKLYNIKTDMDGAVLHIHTENGSKTIIADYVVAADGVNSHIRNTLIGEHPSRILTYYADIDDAEVDTCQFWFGSDIAPRHYAWIFPRHKGIDLGLVADEKEKIAIYFKNFLSKTGSDTNTPKPKGYHIPYWKRMVLYRDRVLYVGDSASIVLPFTYEGIYYAMSSGRLAAQAIIAGKPGLYEEEWDRLFLRKFRFLRLLQTIFMHNDWFAHKMTDLFKDPRFQRSVIGYWSGSREPEGFFITMVKVIKGLFFYRRSP